MNKYDAEKAFTMSLSGSTVMFLYLQLYALAKWYFSLKWKYNVLKIAIAFYLISFPELENFRNESKQKM